MASWTSEEVWPGRKAESKDKADETPAKFDPVSMNLLRERATESHMARLRASMTSAITNGKEYIDAYFYIKEVAEHTLAEMRARGLELPARISHNKHSKRYILTIALYEFVDLDVLEEAVRSPYDDHEEDYSVDHEWLKKIRVEHLAAMIMAKTRRAAFDTTIDPKVPIWLVRGSDPELAIKELKEAGMYLPITVGKGDDFEDGDEDTPVLVIDATEVFTKGAGGHKRPFYCVIPE